MTSNLTIVVFQGLHVIAQYGHWDGDPDGQGITIIKFLRSMTRDTFVSQLNKCRWLNDEKKKEVQEFFKCITAAEDGWMTTTQVEMYHKTYPLLALETGAGILQQVYDTTEDTIWLKDNLDARPYSWTYVIDMDLNVLKVYQNQELLTLFDLLDLPTENEFLYYFEHRNLYVH